MNSKRLCAGLATSLALCAVWFVVTGCEVGSANSAVEITPAHVRLSYGQAQDFTADGGYDYTWSLSDSSMGTLNPRTGTRVTYIHYGSTSNSVQTITVLSSVQGAGGIGVTNSVGTAAAQQSASATVISM